MADAPNELPEIVARPPPETGKTDGPMVLDVKPDGVEAAEPKPAQLPEFLGEDIAVVVINGEKYPSWTSVQVTSVYRTTPRTFRLSVSEPGVGKAWAGYKIKPGDRAAVYLAGIKVCDGYIIVRAPSLTDTGHEVVVEGASQTIDMIGTSAKPAQYKDYTYEQIVRGILRDAGVPFKFVTKNLPAGAGQKIRNFIVHYGETLWEATERLSRMRGVFLNDDADGNLVGSTVTGNEANVATLEEGVNIKSITAVMDDQAVMAKVYAVTQNQGTDESYGKLASQVGAVGTNPNARPWRSRRVVAEEPGSQADMQKRADFEIADGIYTSFACNIVVQGWRRPDGQIWDVTNKVTVKAPSVFPENEGRITLGIRSVTFIQSDGTGTLTSLDLCLQNALGGPVDPGVKGEAPNLLAPSPTPANPETWT